MSKHKSNLTISEQLKTYQTSGSYYRRIQSNLNSVLPPEGSLFTYFRLRSLCLFFFNSLESMNKRRRTDLSNERGSNGRNHDNPADGNKHIRNDYLERY